MSLVSGDTLVDYQGLMPSSTSDTGTLPPRNNNRSAAVPDNPYNFQLESIALRLSRRASTLRD
jgi:hypothetical protein